jgi:hypothetical protein
MHAQTHTTTCDMSSPDSIYRSPLSTSIEHPAMKILSPRWTSPTGILLSLSTMDKSISWPCRELRHHAHPSLLIDHPHKLATCTIDRPATLVTHVREIRATFNVSILLESLEFYVWFDLFWVRYSNAVPFYYAHPRGCRVHCPRIEHSAVANIMPRTMCFLAAMQ